MKNHRGSHEHTKEDLKLSGVVGGSNGEVVFHLGGVEVPQLSRKHLFQSTEAVPFHRL